MSLLNKVIELGRVVASTIGEINSATLYNVAGIAGFSLDDEGNVTGIADADGEGESAAEQDVYSALGIVARPLPPDGDLFAEALAARTEDGLVPFGLRDLRIHRAINAGGTSAPAEGQLMFGGYGGAFVSVTHNTSTGADVLTLYVPHDFDGEGVPQKAHAITIDPSAGNSSISLTHADGVFFSLTEDDGTGSPGIVWATDANTFGRIGGGEVLVHASKIMLKGNVYVGSEAESGVALLAAAASPLCPSLFVSPV